MNKPIRCIYKIFDKETDEILYIGKAENFKIRKNNHVKAIDNRENMQYVHTYIINNDIDYDVVIYKEVGEYEPLDHIEDDVIEKEKPFCNVKKRNNCVDCKRQIYNIGLCRICKTIKQQIKKKCMFPLKRSDKGCYYCGGVKEREEEDCSECKSFERLIGNGYIDESELCDGKLDENYKHLVYFRNPCSRKSYMIMK